MPGLLNEDLAASMANAPDFLDSLLQQHKQQHDSFSLDSSSPHSAYLGGLNAMPPCEADILLGAGRSGLRLDLKELAAMGALGSGGSCDSPLAGASMGSLHRFLPSNNEDSSAAQHVYSSDEFRMFEFKVRRCMRGRSHDWTECPFAHPGEKARRRDPRRFHYSGTACPDFRKGLCRSGDACELAHGVFECWLHPARYRTQPCKDGRACKRRVCFFAHTPEQLRVAPSSSPPPPSSPSAFEQLLIHKQSLEQMLQQQQYERSCYESLFSKSQHQMSSSPTSTLGHQHSPPPMSPPLSPGSPESPPMSPCSSPPLLEQQYAAAAAAAAMLRSRQAELQAAALLSSPPSRRQMERIKSMPSAAAVAAAANQRRRLAAYTSSASFNGRPTNGMNNLVAALRSIDLGGGGYPSPTAGYSVHPQSPPMSPSSWIPHSPLRGPSDFGRFEQQAVWSGVDHHQFEGEGTETGPDLRSKVYSNRSGGENLPECGECPDLGWVTDLVADH